MIIITVVLILLSSSSLSLSLAVQAGPVEILRKKGIPLSLFHAPSLSFVLFLLFPFPRPATASHSLIFLIFTLPLPLHTLHLLLPPLSSASSNFPASCVPLSSSLALHLLLFLCVSPSLLRLPHLLLKSPPFPLLPYLPLLFRAPSPSFLPLPPFCPLPFTFV